MKERNADAEARTFQGAKAQQGMMRTRIWERRILRYLGKRVQRSLAALIELAVMF
jgi:hypothetical protein